jgi:hypothetical protein
MNPLEKRLLSRFRELGEARRAMLLEFADFLAGREGIVEPETPREPLPIPRPEQESVIKAVRRLMETYPMLERAKLLHVTSEQMTRHMVHGDPAVEVIDRLETVFRETFEKHRGAGEGNPSPSQPPP